MLILFNHLLACFLLPYSKETLISECVVAAACLNWLCYWRHGLYSCTGTTPAQAGWLEEASSVSSCVTGLTPALFCDPDIIRTVSWPHTNQSRLSIRITLNTLDTVSTTTVIRTEGPQALDSVPSDMIKTVWKKAFGILDWFSNGIWFLVFSTVFIFQLHILNCSGVATV